MYYVGLFFYAITCQCPHFFLHLKPISKHRLATPNIVIFLLLGKRQKTRIFPLPVQFKTCLPNNYQNIIGAVSGVAEGLYIFTIRVIRTQQCHLNITDWISMILMIVNGYFLFIIRKNFKKFWFFGFKSPSFQGKRTRLLQP